VSVTVYVEGGGDHNKDLETRCRRGFVKFFEKAGLKGRMPKVVVCGGRQRAYDSFRTAHEKAGGPRILLLVDSEEPVTQMDPWEHVRLRQGDGWHRPAGASGDQLNFMVQVMESWFYADKETVVAYYGQSFRLEALSQREDIETLPKADVYDGLKRATRDCRKGAYSKGRDSFEILAQIDPDRVSERSSQAAKLLTLLKQLS
jgi:hypothetical protein